ncbi:hypothetical protein GF412_02245 [Candidatus Micrarchaeota archaeon]|nr:hypothetical protein [Candidatus Micrarchaeota archaeon]MBD3417782.1 hypothetical protein [Candidatus Micrarchaeota archaeon]
MELLNGAGVNLHAPIMYGLPGETRDSMEETYQFAKFLVGSFPNLKLLASRAIPLSGSVLFETLAGNREVVEEYGEELKELDIFDYARLSGLQTKYYTDVDDGEVKEYVKKSLELVPEGRALGFGTNVLEGGN